MSEPLFQDGRPELANEGTAEIGVTTANGMVVVAFAEPVDWLGMSPVEAARVATALMRCACQLDASLLDGLAIDADEDGAH